MERSDQANATARAQWLAELADALEQAQQLAWTLGVSEGRSSEAKNLYGQLESVRIEVESLRRGRARTLPQDKRPLRPDLLPWREPSRKPD